MARQTLPMRELAWNGIRLMIPPEWQPTVLRRDYLLLEALYQPTLALRWQKASRSFDAGQILKELHRSLARDGGYVTPWTVPNRWQDRLDRFDWYGFRWQGSDQAGTGLLLHCRRCARVTILQFHGEVAEAGQILDSFQDHPGDSGQMMAIFDIRALLPPGARLESQEFLAGQFRIRYRIDNHQVELMRFRPADAILSRQSLAGFAGQLAGIQVEDRGEKCVVFWYREPTPIQRFVGRLRRQAAGHWLRLWHLADHNVILGLQARSHRRLDHTLLQQLCRNFTIRPLR
ncbi:hypothetical protein [Desulfolithobacter sp.]